MEWKNYVDLFLKMFESDSNKVREFRRSFISGKKQDRLLSQFELIYRESIFFYNLNDSSIFPEYISWFNGKKFKLVFGLKSITLFYPFETGNGEYFMKLLKNVFSFWNSSLLTEMPQNVPKVSNKKINEAITALSKMSDDQIQKIYKGNTKKINELLQSDSLNPLVRQLKERLAIKE